MRRANAASVRLTLPLVCVACKPFRWKGREMTETMRFGDQLNGVRQCPHCAKPNPLLIKVWISEHYVSRRDGGPESRWGSYACSSCGHVVTAKGRPGDLNGNALIVALFPEPRAAHNEIPELARHFLQQAFDTLHAPDAAGVMAASAVDAMLVALGYDDGSSLYDRINLAVTDGHLTQKMADWAHHVRLEANRPRHADKENPRLSPEEARKVVEFAEGLGNFLFVLSAQIAKAMEPVSSEQDESDEA